MKKRLSKTLAAAGVASRRACEELIFKGRVVVNGEIVRTPQILVRREDCILVNGKKVKAEEKKVYYLLNKPAGYICTTVEKKFGAKRVLDLFSHIPYRLFTAGRLDQETTGLIIVTNDGAFANRMMHPSYNITKEYLAKTEQEITFEHLKAISDGVWIQNRHIRPITVKKVRKGTLKVVVAEGKKHEVRTLLSLAELTVKELIRLRIGPLSLGSLAPGEYRELKEEEIKLFIS
jgi:23S rRNA pseudouridine2605 synthase